VILGEDGSLVLGLDDEDNAAYIEAEDRQDRILQALRKGADASGQSGRDRMAHTITLNVTYKGSYSAGQLADMLYDLAMQINPNLAYVVGITLPEEE
jgi:hypothetical protein